MSRFFFFRLWLGSQKLRQGLSCPTSTKACSSQFARQFRSNWIAPALSAAILGLLTVTLAQPAQCGEWKVDLELNGKSKAHLDESRFYSSMGSNGTHAWSSKKIVKGYSSVTFTEGARGTLLADYIPNEDNYPSASSELECGGSITPVFTWVPTTSLQEDPPPSVLKYKEMGSASASRGAKTLGVQQFPIYSKSASLSMKNPVTETDADGITIRSEAHTTVLNPKRSDVVHGPTCSLKSSGTGSTPPNKFAGMEHYCGVSYSVELGAVYGKARLLLYKQNPQTGQLDILAASEGPPVTKPTVGDRVWTGIEFVVGSKTHLDPDLQNIKLRIQEEEDSKLGADQHTEADNHVDVTLPLTPGTEDAEKFKWQKKAGATVDDDNSSVGWEDTSEPFSTSGGQYGARYRVLWAWDSQKIQKMDGMKLWDHNGDHTVSVINVNGQPIESASGQKIEFLPDEDGGGYSRVIAKVTSRECNVQNLVIKNIESPTTDPDYVKFDPDDPEISSVNIKFDISDNGDPKTYKWYIFFRETGERSWDGLDVGMVSGTQNGPGTINAKWDGQQLNPNLYALNAGTYTFEVLVVKDENQDGIFSINSEGHPVEDHVWLRSNYLKFQEHDLNFPSDKTDANHLIASYFLSSIDKPAKNIELKLLDGKWNTVSKTLGPTDVNVENEKLIQIPQDIALGKGATIFSGEDSLANKYRDHVSRRILAVNLKTTYHKALIYEGPQVDTRVLWMKDKFTRTKIKTSKGLGIMVPTKVDVRVAADNLSAKSIYEWVKVPTNDTTSYRPWIVHMAGHGEAAAGDAMYISKVNNHDLYYNDYTHNDGRLVVPDGTYYDNAPGTGGALVENIVDNPLNDVHFWALAGCGLANNPARVPNYGLMNGLLKRGTNAVLGFKVNTVEMSAGVRASALFFDHFYEQAGIAMKQVGTKKGRPVFESYTLDEALVKTHNWLLSKVVGEWGYYPNTLSGDSDEYYGLDTCELRISPSFSESPDIISFNVAVGSPVSMPKIYLLDVVK